MLFEHCYAILLVAEVTMLARLPHPWIFYILQCVLYIPKQCLWAYYISYFVCAWNFVFLMWILTRASGKLFLLCAECTGPVQELEWPDRGLLDLLLCSETLVSDRCCMSELPVPGVCRPVFLCRGRIPWVRGMATEMDEKHCTINQNSSVVAAKCLYLEFLVQDRTS